MNLKIDAKNTTATEAIHSYIETKFEPLMKYQEIQNKTVKVTIETYQNDDKEFSAHIENIHGTHTDKDLYAAIDIVVEKLDKQLRRLKTKRINFRQNRESLKEQFDTSNIELTESEDQ